MWAESQGDQGKRADLAVFLQILFALESLECVSGVGSPNAIDGTVEVAFLGEGLLDFLVAFGGGLLLGGAAYHDRLLLGFRVRCLLWRALRRGLGRQRGPTESRDQSQRQETHGLVLRQSSAQKHRGRTGLDVFGAATWNLANHAESHRIAGFEHRLDLADVID